MNNRRGIAPIIFILIIIALLAGGILAWQYLGGPKEEAIADKTANWKVYQNERFKYELKYPPELEMNKEQIESYGLTAETVPSISWVFPAEDTPNIAKFIAVNVDENTKKKSLRSFSGYDPAKCTIEGERDAFLRINCEMNSTTRSIVSAFSKNDWLYTIFLLITTNTDDLSGIDFSSEINTYNLILSTFKFLEGEVIVPTKKSAKDVKVMTYMMQIEAAAEIYYGENGSYLNFASGEEAWNLRKQIQNETGEWPGMITSDDAYCADVTLSDGKTKYCVDSRGRRGENLGCSRIQLTCIGY